jgi:hypothetical protein
VTSLNVQTKGSLAPQTVREKEQVPDYLWNSIYPQNEQSVPQVTASGRNAVRLFVGGEWRCVVVDDRLPVAVCVVQESAQAVEQLKEAVGITNAALSPAPAAASKPGSAVSSGQKAQQKAATPAPAVPVTPSKGIQGAMQQQAQQKGA